MASHFRIHYAVIVDINGIDVAVPFSASFEMGDAQAKEVGQALAANIPGAQYLYVEMPDG